MKAEPKIKAVYIRRKEPTDPRAEHNAFIVGKQPLSVFDQEAISTLKAIQRRGVNGFRFVVDAFVYGYICGKRAERARRKARCEQ